MLLLFIRTLLRLLHYRFYLAWPKLWSGSKHPNQETRQENKDQSTSRAVHAMSNSDLASVQRLKEAPSILDRAAIELARTEAESEVDLLHHLPHCLMRVALNPKPL